MTMKLPAVRASYLRMFSAAPGDPEAIERALGLTLPDDVKEIATFFPGQLLGGISNRELTGEGPYNVVAITQDLRQARQLPAFELIRPIPPGKVLQGVQYWENDVTSHLFKVPARSNATTGMPVPFTNLCATCHTNAP